MCEINDKIFDDKHVRQRSDDGGLGSIRNNGLETVILRDLFFSGWIFFCATVMDTNELALLCSALSVKERDGLVKTLDEGLINMGERRLSLCLVGRVFTSKLINREAFMNVIPSVWRISEGVEVEWIEVNTFAFHFKNFEDLKRVLSGGPWSFDRAMIIFEEPVGDGDIKNMKFNKLDIWVQIHNMPLLCMTEEIGIFLGKMIGDVHDVDLEAAKDVSGRFIRVRVVIDVLEPLLRSLRVDLLGNGKITTMLLRHERLLDYCFKCSCLGHSLLECTDTSEGRDMKSEANLRLNVWLRTNSPPKRFTFRNGRHDRPWGENSNKGHKNRSSDDWRKGSGATTEEIRAGERWRSKCSSGQRKLEGCSSATLRCMGKGKDSIDSGENRVAAQY
ncbi:hypothetical protein EZV62_015265 [Acer yangbiense]|uniref:DUF4283 domain-containing protein n=1 Tax=Acer yangbiense TaxID=1000413 RepID=A0A5C7HX07_9ROSI|nr:hypothetical protein EZV62_015265 [Acer yangbiense]